MPMPRLMAVLLVFVACSVTVVALADDVPVVDKDTVLALAAKHIEGCEPKLETSDQETIRNLRQELESSRATPSLQDDIIADLVSQMAVALAAMKSLDTLTVGSAILVQWAPDKPRPANVFAAVLHAAGETEDAITLLRYTVSLEPDSALARLNLANALMDVEGEGAEEAAEEARAILEALVFEDDRNHRAHRALATYWYEKRDWAKFQEELMKAAEGGGVVKKKKDEKQEEVADEKVVQPGDPLETMTTKVEGLKHSVPLTTADIIADELPDVAAKIREEYGKLTPAECAGVPTLPQANITTSELYRRNSPILKQWVESTREKYAVFMKTVMGVDPKATRKQQLAQARELARQSLAQMLGAARQTAQTIGQQPGVPGEIASQLPGNLDTLGRIITDVQGLDVTSPEARALQDTGALFSRVNYEAYRRIAQSYDSYFREYFDRYEDTVDVIRNVHISKIEEENESHRLIDDQLAQEHADALKAGDPYPHGRDDIQCRKESLRHRKALNRIGNDYYHMWVNLYMPRYTQVVKPALEEAWYVQALYIKNMNDPAVMKREYIRMAGAWAMWLSRAVGGIGMGSEFKWVGSTDDEERELMEAIDRAEEEAKQKDEVFRAQTQTPEKSWLEWLGEHLMVEASVDFLAVKITPRSIEFEAWAMGPTGRVKFDAVDGTIKTYTGLSAKFQVGLEVAGVGGTVGSKVDLAGRYAKWGVDDGSYSEGYEGPALQGKLSVGPVRATGQVAVDTELNARANGRIGLGGDGVDVLIQGSTP
jgi:hypothetical protein